MDKALWFIAGARDLTIAYDWINKVDYVDKLIVRNYMHHHAHEIGRNYFLQHPEYDYFIISSDDVLGCESQLKMLLQDEKENNFPVVSGWCNVKLDAGWAAVSRQPHDGIQTKKTSYEAYHFVNMEDIILAKCGYPFAKMWFVGLPLTLIQRELLEQNKITFSPFIKIKDRCCVTEETRQNGRGVMFDLQFAIECWRNNIPIIVDTRIFLLHFGMTGPYVKVGSENPTITLIKAGQTPELISPPVKIDDYIMGETSPAKAFEDLHIKEASIHWKRFVENNMKSKRAWYNGLPYKWWWGMSCKDFLQTLPSHLDKKKEPLWFTSLRR